MLHGALLELVAQRSRHSGFDEARRNGVASNVAGANFARNGHGKPDQSCLRRRVIGLACLAHLAEDAGDVDDASPALLEHRAHDLLGAHISGSEISLQHRIPVGTLHPHDQLVARDAGVVDQDVDLAELGDRRLDGGLDLFLVVYVDGEGCGFAAGAANLIDQFVELFLIAGGDGHSRSRGWDHAARDFTAALVRAQAGSFDLASAAC